MLLIIFGSGKPEAFGNGANRAAGIRWILPEFASCLGGRLQVYPRLMFLRAASASGSAALYFVFADVAVLFERQLRGV
ncbi:hypothetical protein CHH27_16185 [Labrenzia sp. VG12]|nr:hypothetical protein CHH27_16185 [Labrenzia sp. VG12]